MRARDQHTVYDFGMNNGDDCDYYLKKGLKVVGVEANPRLCAFVRRRFPTAIADGELAVLNVALSEEASAEPMPFYVHNTNHTISQLPKPLAIDDFTEILVPRRAPSQVIREFGEPYYVKVDIERSDHIILREMFAAGITPPFVSAESHVIDVFALMVSAGYNSFNLVDGRSVPVVFDDVRIVTTDRRESFSFKPHSAGPFGEDIPTPWYNAEAFFYALATARLGWKDIHASNVIEPTITWPQPTRVRISERLRDILPSVRRAFRARTSFVQHDPGAID